MMLSLPAPVLTTLPSDPESVIESSSLPVLIVLVLLCQPMLITFLPSPALIKLLVPPLKITVSLPAPE